MQAKITYRFSAKLWKDKGKGGWVFVSLPKDISKEIKETLGWQEEGWGRMKVSASIANIIWDSAIWFDKKQQIYLLPVKAEIRKRNKLTLGQLTEVVISI